MVLEITVSSIVSFASSIVLLSIYSFLDLRDRSISNRIMFVGGIICISIVTMTGHLFTRAVLHVSAIVSMLTLGYLLFRLGSFGGADVKTTATVAILSPGIEFIYWSDPILEGIVASGLLLGIVLLIAYLLTKSRKSMENRQIIPLIPILLVAYLGLQLLALV